MSAAVKRKGAWDRVWLTRNPFKRRRGRAVEAQVHELSRLVRTMLDAGLRIRSWNAKSIKEENVEETPGVD